MHHMYTLYFITGHLFLFALAARKLKGQILSYLHWLHGTRCPLFYVGMPLKLYYFSVYIHIFSFALTPANVCLS